MRFSMRLAAAGAALTLAVLAIALPRNVQADGAATPSPDAAPRRVKVLFLGDNGHHKPLERFRQAVTEMTLRGVDMTYVDELSQITPENLKRFDVLALYANTEKVTPEAEKAILDYVAGGGGYAVIHCGSYCFLNSKPLTELTGGRFQKHGAGVFKETHVHAEHPILKDLKEIESWDETYVHNMHNEKEREVLSQRIDKDGKEPYTWTRTHGKGRVFYTAWGHDERTWGNADFINLLERGLRWSAGDWALQPAVALKPFEYGEGKTPNYVPSETWGKTGDPITKIQKPVPPAESMKHLITPAGVEAKLFASEPQIFKPICMNWDERGRLWIAETFDYPNELNEKPGAGRDRISIVEDRDHDGVADTFTVFATGLSIPTSILPARGGVIVAQAPDMLFLKDTDGDNKADVRQVLFSGWGTRDTHAGPSNLRWGPDNWIYGIVGYSGFNGTVGGEQVRFRNGNGIWRMKPDGTKLEFLASLTNNAWGLGFSEEGHLFASTANGDPSFYMHIPNRAYESVRGVNVKALQDIADSARIFAATKQVRQVDHHGNYTAGAGHALYTARTWPKYYWNRTAFIAEPTGHVVGQFLLQPNGSAFIARNDGSVLASDDEWTSPIMAEVGPDGQIWVIDWYNFIVQHNPIPRGFEAGKGGAYETNLRDKTHGRIYRLVYKDGTPSQQYDLSKATPAQLVEVLKSDNQFWRMSAQRLLVEKGDKSVAEQLAALVQVDAAQGVDAIGLNPAGMHALWTLHGLGLMVDSNEKVTAAVNHGLSSKVAGVRKAAVDVMPRTKEGVNQLLASGVLNDADPQVRKSALLALAEMPQEAEAGKAIYAALSKPDMATDRWLPDAAMIAAARHDASFLQAALASVKVTQPAGASAEAAASKNLFPNASFEEVNGERPRAWRPRNYSGESKQELSTTVARTGKNSLMLQSQSGSDTSWFIDVPVEPNSTYRLSAWIKTDEVKTARGGLGALLNVHGTDFKTKSVVGTNDWQQVEVNFTSGSMTRVSINCLFGGWGHATGKAYYDDLELVKTQGAITALPGATGKVLSAVITHYALRAPKESVVATLASLKSTQPQMATIVIDALSAAWPEGKAAAPELSEADVKELQAVMALLPAAGRDRLLALSGKWGRSDIFGDALASAVKDLQVTLDDNKAPLEKRRDAAQRLIAIADNPDSVTAILKHVNPAALPAVQIGMLQAIKESRSPAVGEQLIASWKNLTPTAQKIALPMLLNREAWTRSLLAGVKSGAVNPKDVLPQQWQAMTSHPEKQISDLAKQLQKSTGQTVSADRKAIVDKLLPLASQQGDLEKGRLVYEKNCMVCHAMEGKGGKVGPDLTGIGARPKADLLIEVIDPNRSVEGNYRQWSAKTADDVITGRLAAESQTSIEIMDATGTSHPIQRSELKSLVASEKSVMPEGFEALPEADLKDLMEFMAASKTKH